MYDWLADALADTSHLLTASRRLARLLRLEYGLQQLASGKSAWRTPTILSWQDWLADIVATAELSKQVPTRINTHQSRLLWERCLRREISDPLLNISLLARQSSDAWLRLHEWMVPLDDCEQAALGRDKKVFARAARNYQSILDRENWVDQSGLPDLATQLIREQRVTLPACVTLAGFDRIVPQLDVLLAELKGAGCDVATAASSSATSVGRLHCYQNSDAELRAAGAWARNELEQAPNQRIAVVVTNLEQDAPRCARLLKEGLVPGWQNAASDIASAVNVSYGRELTSYPAIAIALLALRWLNDGLSTASISLLLRTPLIGQVETDGRIRLELRLRQLPDRSWTPEMLLGALTDSEKAADARDWLRRVAALTERRSLAAKRAAPSTWAAMIDDVLRVINWPGEKALDTVAFQLVNRWRELLNELARLELLAPTMTLGEALGRLGTMARDTVFQPEVEGAVVDLLGPLEAAGMRFDKLWITGLSANNWPPPSRPLSLVSRELQRNYGMPDADPQDTLDYARRVISRLTGSASQYICSYPLAEGDAEQTVSGLLDEREITLTASPEDPHWYASRLLDNTALIPAAHDPVPAMTSNETLAGGAATLQRQFAEPFAAFVYGRLGVRILPVITSGLAANIRGNLIHAALHQLYADLPSSEDIGSWDQDTILNRTEVALRNSFRAHERYADGVLKALLAREKIRVAGLLEKLIAVDSSRSRFTIADVEQSIDAEINGVRLRLRIDRIDRQDDGEVMILDYKTGMPKRLLDRHGEPNDVQLIAYTCAIADPVGGIALINIDSRAINIDAAGRAVTPDCDWEATLTQWQDQVAIAASEIRDGDVRMNGSQTVQIARPLSLLSRFPELRRDA